MKRLYKVTFINGDEAIVYCFSPVTASIRSASDRIKEGKDWQVKSVEDDRGNLLVGNLLFSPIKKEYANLTNL